MIQIFAFWIGLVAATGNLFASELWLEAISDLEVAHFSRPVEFDWKLDPFLRAPGRAFPSPQERELVLETVIFDKERPVALINKIAVEKGDLIENRRVIEIGRDFVVLEGEQSLLELVLPPPGMATNAEVKK